MTRKLLSALGVVALFTAAGLYAAERTRYGVSFTDEGYYASAPLRYVLGDVPLRDEYLGPHRMFDVLLAPVFAWHPDVTLLELRLAGVALQLLAAFVLFLATRGLAPDLVRAAACAAAAFAPIRIFAPGYHLMGACSFVVAFALLLRGCRARSAGASRALGASGGLVAFLGIASYLPLAAELAVPAFLWVRGVLRPDRDPCVRRASGALLVTTGALVAAAVAAVFATGLAGDWWYDHGALSSAGVYASSLEERFVGSVLGAVPYAVTVSVAAALTGWAFLAVLRLWRPERDWIQAGLVAGALAGGAWLLVLFADSSAQEELAGRPTVVRMRLTFLALGLHGTALFLPRSERRGRAADPRGWRFTVRVLLVGSLFFAFFQALLSANPHKVAWAVLPLFATGVLALYNLAAERVRGSGEPRAAALALVLACVSVGAGVSFANAHFAYDDLPPSELRRPLVHPRLRGIRTSTARAMSLQQTAHFLRDELEPGDFLLAYDSLPLFYFLTSTRPAVNTVWTSQRTTFEVRGDSLRYMLENRRIPELCVRDATGEYSADPEVDPLNAWVERYYALIAVHGRFEIWRRMR